MLSVPLNFVQPPKGRQVVHLLDQPLLETLNREFNRQPRDLPAWVRLLRIHLEKAERTTDAHNPVQHAVVNPANCEEHSTNGGRNTATKQCHYLQRNTGFQEHRIERYLENRTERAAWPRSSPWPGSENGMDVNTDGATERQSSF